MNYLFDDFKEGRKDLLISIVAGLIVGIAILIVGLGPQPAMASQSVTISSIARVAPKPAVPITEKSSIEDILGLMLNSHTMWKTLKAEAITVWQPTKEPQTVYTTIEIKQVSKVRLSIKQYDDNNKQMFDTQWISDGYKAYEQDNLLRRYTEYVLPSFAHSVDDFGPQSDPNLGYPVIVRHPMAVLIPSPVADYLYPTGLIQRQGKFGVLGVETISSRVAVIITWVGFDENGLQTGKATFWVDSYTGIILKAQVYGGDSWDDIAEETTIVNIVFDSGIEPTTFVFTPFSDYEYLPLEKFFNP